MRTSSTSTLEDAPNTATPPLRLLTYVLGFDDLLAERTVGFALDELAAELRIGRGSDAPAPTLVGRGELRVPDRWMSREHARLARVDGRDVLFDGGSANGSFVNGERVPAEGRVLSDGDVIELGHSLLCYRLVDARRAAALGRVVDARGGLGPTRTFNPEVAQLVADLQRVAPSRESVLVLAETGAGKEVVAATVHALSGRRGALCTVDCGAVPESLFEGIFFGHRRGAFTGAVENRVGEVQRADGGTLFLDEVANMSLASQATLLRVIEDGRVTPLGATQGVTTDVRWVAATNRDLFRAPEAFRPDLLRRLAGYVARLPPLRARREDLGVLAAHALREAGVTRASITTAAARRLLLGPLPGNIRELRAALRSAALLAGDEAIDLPHLPRTDEPLDAEPAPAASRASEPPPSAVPPAPRAPSSVGTAPDRRGADAPSRAQLEEALRATGGNVFQTARALATSPRQLYRWIERHGLALENYRK